MNYSIYGADRTIHLKVVVVALISGILVAGFSISMRNSSDEGLTQTARVMIPSMIPSMIIEPATTTTEQITCQSSSTATMAARPLDFFPCAKRQPATPIRKLRLAPSSGGLHSINAKRSPAIANLDQG